MAQVRPLVPCYTRGTAEDGPVEPAKPVEPLHCSLHFLGLHREAATFAARGFGRAQLFVRG